MIGTTAAVPVRRVLVPQDIGGPPLPPFGARVAVETLTGRTMGTTWKVALVADEGRDVDRDRDAIERLLASLVASLSNWEPDSALSRFNRAPVGAWQSLSPALYDVLAAAVEVRVDSGGAFDPTVGRAVAAWGFGPRDAPGPVGPGTGVAPGDRAVELDPTGRRARRSGDAVVDLCGIAKGYAVDRLSGLLADRGATHHLVEIGGELRGSGVKPDASPWWVALEDPPDLRMPGDASTVAALHGLSVATSGDYRHFFAHDGRRFAHTIDPRTGDPVDRPPASVTVLHRDCMFADAHATAITVLGADAGLAYARRRGLAARVIVRTPDGAIAHTTPAFDAMLA